MLDRLVLHQPEAEFVVAIVVVVQGGADEAATAGVAGRSAPVEPHRALRVQVGDFGSEAGQVLWRVSGLDRRERAFPGLLRPLGELDAAAQHQHPPGREEGQQCVAVRLLKEVVGAVVLRGVRSQAVEADLRRLAPAADHRQLAATVEHPRREELDFGPLVARDRIAGPRIDGVVGAHIVGVADAEREAAAGIGALEERVPAQGPALEHRIDVLEDPLTLVGGVGMRGLQLLRLLLLDGGLSRRRRCALRLGRPRRRRLLPVGGIRLFGPGRRAGLLRVAGHGDRRVRCRRWRHGRRRLRGQGARRGGRHGGQREQFQHSESTHV